MSTSSTRSHDTDSYQIVSSYDASSEKIELDLVRSLVKGSVISDFSGNKTTLDSVYVDNSAIANYPNGIVTKNSVISLEHVDPSYNQTYTVNLGNDHIGNTVDFSILPTTSAFYDNNYVVTQSYIQNNYDISYSDIDPEAAKFLAVFDEANGNHHAQHAVNSRWNSTLGPYTSLDVVGTDPVAITEDASYNELSPLGMEGTGLTSYTARYAVSEPTDGSISFVDIDNQYQPNIDNNLEIVDRQDYSEFDVNKDVGIFKIQQDLSGSVQTTVQLDNGLALSADDYLTAMPLIDASANGGVLDVIPTADQRIALNVSWFDDLG